MLHGNGYRNYRTLSGSTVRRAVWRLVEGSTFDELNRLAQSTDAMGGITQFSYDAADDLTSIHDASGLTTTMVYNGFGEVAEKNGPATASTGNTYDESGNLMTISDARGTTATFSYDAADRLKQAAYPDQSIAYTYDVGVNGKGHLTGASDLSHVMVWQYDSLGRVTTKTQTVGSLARSVNYGFSADDLTSIATPSGQTVTYTYTNHRISSVSVNGATLISGVTYEPFGEVRGWTWANGTTEIRVHDGDGNLTQLAGGDPVTLTSDSAMRVVSKTDSADSSRSWVYDYDTLDRITTATSAAVNAAWTYDGTGNRLTQGGPPGPIYATPNLTLTYNGRGRLSTVAGSSGTSTYTYNAAGQRIRKMSGGATISYVYDEKGNLLGEYGPSGLIQETIWLDQYPIATIRPDGSGGVTLYYVHADERGAPWVVTRPSDSAVVWRWDHDPFGTTAPNENPSGLGSFSYNLRLPGQYFDAESGLIYNYFRDYDSQVGRFIESDPLTKTVGADSYAYAGENPVNNIDPTGLAYFAYRALSGLPWLGPLSDNALDDAMHTAISHEQLFFEDGMSPTNIGFFNDSTLKTEPNPQDYHRIPGIYNDCVMRQAVQNVRVESYHLIGNNCQDWASSVQDEYKRLMSNPVATMACHI
jgi:RHS repeat-associated protein